MPWSGLLNREKQIERFRRAVEQNRLASTYLFVGPPGVGKRTFALRLAEALLCERPSGSLDGCGNCPSCLQVQSQSHPDLILISKPPDKSAIPVELFIGGKEHRRQVGLIHDIGLKPFRGGYKVAIVDDADYLNDEGANSLLKTLEEPPPKTVLILIGTSEQQQMQTILSRSQIVRFESLTADQVEMLLGQIELPETNIPLDQLAAAAEGSIELAFDLADTDLFGFRQQLLGRLASGDPSDQGFCETMIKFVDMAGTENIEKRKRLVLLSEIALKFFRWAYLASTQGIQVVNSDAVMQQAVDRLLLTLRELSVGAIQVVSADAIERTIELQDHIAMNVNKSNSIDAWLVDLGRIYRGKYVAV